MQACIHRSNMPQIDEPDLPELFKFLAGRGVAVLSGPIPIVKPRTIQCRRESKNFLVPHPRCDIPILVSGSFDILDGNHRYFTLKRDGEATVQAHMIADHTHAVLEHLFAFPKAYRADDDNRRIAP